MENVIAPANTPPVAGSQPATPVTPVVPAAEDPATEAARLRQENIDLQKRIADKDKHIGDLSTEKSTLESRLSGYQAVESVVPQTPVAPEGGEPVTPQAPGGSRVTDYVRPEDIPEIIERTSFLTKMKDDNKDMMEFGLEPVIAARASALMASGKSFKESVASAVKEQREKFDKIKQPSTPVPAEPVPSGLKGEAGASVPTPPAPKTEDALGDEGDERKKLRAKRGL